MTTTPTASPELPDSGRRTHELKTDPAVFAAVLAGAKTHEIRLNDRGFQVGDELLLRETMATGADMLLLPRTYPLTYTGRTATRIVSHIQTGYGLADGWCILSFAGRAQPEGEAPQAESFQQRVQPWMMACFGAEISADKVERNNRFTEESLELGQACGMTKDRVLALVDYVYDRPLGEPAQEVGGVMVTLAALCLAQGLRMHDAAEVELARIWTKVEAIRAKQLTKPRGSPLPIPAATLSPLCGAQHAKSGKEVAVFANDGTEPDWSSYAAAEAAQQAAAPGALPERDLSKPAEQQGLFRKFDVRRTDDSDQPGGKHHDCRYYVLDLTHDQHAPAAMLAYAAACASTHPQLAADIVAEFGAPGTPEAPKQPAHGHRDDYYLLANGRRLGLESISRVRNMPNWVLAMELFATGSGSAYQICRDAGVDPEGTTIQRAAQLDGSQGEGQ